MAEGRRIGAVKEGNLARMFHVEHCGGVALECSTWNIVGVFGAGMFHVEHFGRKRADWTCGSEKLARMFHVEHFGRKRAELLRKELGANVPRGTFWRERADRGWKRRNLARMFHVEHFGGRGRIGAGSEENLARMFHVEHCCKEPWRAGFLVSLYGPGRRRVLRQTGAAEPHSMKTPGQQVLSFHRPRAGW